MKTTRTFLCALGLAGLTSLPAWAATVETQGFLKYEAWFPPLRDASLTGTAVTILVDSDPNYAANTPDMTSYSVGLDSRSVFPDDTHEQYGARLTGWLTPTVTDDYNFYIASDDNSELWISTDATEANLQLAAQEPGCCHGFVEPGTGDQTTVSPIHLVAGQKYALRILHKEGTGGDFVQVAWQGITGTTPAASLSPLRSTVLSSMADPAGASVTITQQPASASTPENAPVTFSIAATAVTPYGQYTAGGTPAQGGTPPLGTKSQLANFYQWFTNGVEVPGANGTSLTIPWPKKATDNAKKVKCYVAVPGVPVFSSEAILTVTADTTPPTVVKVASDISFTNVTVTFSEPVSDSALSASHYTIDQGVTVSAVSRVDLLTVKLATSKLPENKVFKLTISGVQDTATPANTIAANSSVQFRSFVFVTGTIVHKKYNNVSDNAGADTASLFNDPRYPDRPDRVDLETMWEYPPGGNGRVAADPARNYFDSIEGFFIPPTTGDYVFFTCGADRWSLYLSTDDNPANRARIAMGNGWTDPRHWITGHSTDMTPARSDTYGSTEWPNGNTIHLNGGTRYYMMSIHHDPSWCGADDFSATFKLAADADPLDGDAPKLTGSNIGYYVDPTGASITFNKQPQNFTGVEGGVASFSAAVTATSAYGGTVFYQWQSAPKGSSTWTDIAGATAATHSPPILTLAVDGTQFRLVATVVPISEISDVATLTVLTDTFPPVPIAGAMQDATAGIVDVGVAFDEPVEDASGSLLSNYSVSSGTISSLTWYTNRFTANSQNPMVTFRKQSALLKVTGFSGTSGTVTVKNVKDAHGNQMTSKTLPFTVDTKMKWGVVGANEFGSWNAVVPVAANGWDVYSDGMTEWANYDETTFVYEQITGDFDKKVRVEYQDGSSTWARAGLIVRDVTNFGVDRATQVGSGSTTAPYDGQAGRYQKCHVNPVGATLSGPGNPANQSWEGNRRLDTGGQSTSALTGPNAIPQYPSAWCRIQRAGQTFTIYRSDDGVNWVTLGSTTWGVTDESKTPMPATVYVGPEFTPENGNITQVNDQGTFLARFRDYGDYVTSFDPQLKISLDATGKVTLTWASGTLQSAATVQGTYTPVANATSPYVVTPASGATFYRVKQ